jgi:hypothetical protein
LFFRKLIFVVCAASVPGKGRSTFCRSSVFTLVDQFSHFEGFAAKSEDFVVIGRGLSSCDIEFLSISVSVLVLIFVCSQLPKNK